MWKTTLKLTVCATLLASNWIIPVEARPRDFIGTWVNTDYNSSGITKLVISQSGRNLNIQVFGQCQPTDCDWGTTELVTYGDNVQDRNHLFATASYDKNFAETLLTIKLTQGGNKINLESFTEFTDNSNRQNYFSQAQFQRGNHQENNSNIQEDCVSFDPNNAQVRRINGSWKVVDGSHWLFDFGNQRNEANQALTIIKNYSVNQSCFVGRPDPSFQYLLVNNNAPSGRIRGEDCLSFNPNNLEVRRINGNWKIVDGSNWMFDFGSNQAEARQSLEIIKNKGFTQSCFVGRPNPSLEYLRQ
jgi:hypothetical protein